MLKLKNVSKYYYQDGVIASGFTKINLELHMGEFVVITGESGSGKSTLLNVLSGLDTYEDGEMYINGEETSHYTEEDYLEYRRKYVSNIFQNFNLVNSYTVFENIELTMLMNGKKKSEVKEYVNELIDKVGLTKYKNTFASKLSGGQKQRVAIARALANDTPIIVADEPTGSLDSRASSSILKLLHEVSKDKLVIVVTHNKSEIEEYATRLIRMHDGKILENKVVKEINLDSNVHPKEVKNIHPLSKIRLGIRNAFNIPVKFILMFVIFMLIAVSLTTFYGNVKIAEYEEMGYSYNAYFHNDSSKRIIIKKPNNELFTSNDYEKIKNIANIDYLVENDLINDYTVSINSSTFYLDGGIVNQKPTKVDVGRLPEKDDEIVVYGNENDWYLSDMAEELLKETFSFDNAILGKVKIVGIIYDNSFDYIYKFYIPENFANKIITLNNQDYYNNGYELYDRVVEGMSGEIYIIPTDKLKKGEAIVKDNLESYCPNYNCLNAKIKVSVKNIYYNDKADLKITNVYTRDNANKLLNINYDDYYNVIFISNEDYNNLYNKGNYQSSVFVKDLKDLDSVNKALEDLGYTTLKLRDSKSNDAEMVSQVFKIFRLMMTIFLTFTLFFITYFIIKIIYKSRNSYYVTLRTLGSTKKVCINILMNELLTLATFTYTIFLIFIYLVNHNIISNKYFTDITKYLDIPAYLVIYGILIVISVLIAYRYGRKIFKNSIIKNYGERV